jgi:hypothetical protein
LGCRRHAAGPPAEQSRAQAVLALYRGGADASLRIENFLADSGIGRERVGGKSGERQAGDEGTCHVRAPLGSLDDRFHLLQTNFPWDLQFLRKSFRSTVTLWECSNRCVGDRLVLCAAAAANADGAYNLAILLDRNATREDHHPGLIRYVDAEEPVARLAVAATLQRRDIESIRREGLVEGDFDAAEPCPVHARESRQIGAGIHDRYIRWLADLLRLGDRRRYDQLGFVHCHHDRRTRDRG